MYVIMARPSTAVIVDAVTAVADRGHRAFADMRARLGVSSPSGRLLLCVSEIRDLYILCKAEADSTGRVVADAPVMTVDDASWGAVQFWAVSHVRRTPGTDVGTSLSREQEFGPGLSRLVSVKLCLRTEWLVDHRVERVYLAL